METTSLLIVDCLAIQVTPLQDHLDCFLESIKIPSRTNSVQVLIYLHRTSPVVEIYFRRTLHSPILVFPLAARHKTIRLLQLKICLGRRLSHLVSKKLLCRTTNYSHSQQCSRQNLGLHYLQKNPKMMFPWLR